MAHTPQTRARFLAKVLHRRQQWLHENGPCRRCGSWEDLQVHHREQEQKVTHRIWTWRADRRAKELAKCEPICRACHTVIHSLLNRKPHGWAGYRRGCRCDVCRASIATQVERQRARRAAARVPKRTAPAAVRRPWEHSYRDKWEVIHDEE